MFKILRNWNMIKYVKEYAIKSWVYFSKSVCGRSVSVIISVRRSKTVKKLLKIQIERFSQWMSGNSCVSKWFVSKTTWNLRRRDLLLRMTSLRLTMSARIPTLMKRRCSRKHRRRELGSYPTCLQVDYKCMLTIRCIFQLRTKRSRPLETVRNVTLRQYREGHEDKIGRALEFCCRNSSIFQV